MPNRNILMQKDQRLTMDEQEIAGLLTQNAAYNLNGLHEIPEAHSSASSVTIISEQDKQSLSTSRGRP